MKKILKVVTVLLSIIGCSVLGSCSNNNEEPSVDKVGTWKSVITLTDDYKDFDIITSFSGTDTGSGVLLNSQTMRGDALSYMFTGEEAKSPLQSYETTNKGIEIVTVIHVNTSNNEGKSMTATITIYFNGKEYIKKTKQFVGVKGNKTNPEEDVLTVTSVG